MRDLPLLIGIFCTSMMLFMTVLKKNDVFARDGDVVQLDVPSALHIAWDFDGARLAVNV